MNVDNILNLEERTGIKDDDINEFLKKVDAVDDAIKGMVSGTVKPEDVRIEGVLTEEEKAEIAKVELAKEQERKRKAEELMHKRREEEMQRWWEGAEVHVSSKFTENDMEGMEENMNNDINRHKMRYSANYSRWEEWTPNDPATVEEKKLLSIEEDKRKNEEFEKSNKDFCDNFKADLEARNATLKKTESSAEVLRIKGNNFFKKQLYDHALGQYMEALKLRTYDTRILLNIAQCHIKRHCFLEAEEFLKRTLYVKKDNPKALSRQAFVQSKLGKLLPALESIRMALALEPSNEVLSSQLLDIETQMFDAEDGNVINTMRERMKDITTKRSDAAMMTSPTNICYSKMLCDGFDTFDNLSSALSKMHVSSNDVPEIIQNTSSGDCLSTETEMILELQNKALHVFNTCGTESDRIKTETNDANTDSVSQAIRLCRVYSRTSGLLTRCVDFVLSQINENGRLHSDQITDKELSLLSKCLDIVSLSAVSQHASQVYIVESSLLMRVKELISYMSTTLRSIAYVSVLLSCLKLLDTCCTVADRGYGKTYCYIAAQTIIISDQMLLKSLLKYLLYVVAAWEDTVVAGSTEILNSFTTNMILPHAQISDKGKLIETVCRILYEMINAFHAKKKNAISLMPSVSTDEHSSSTTLTCVLGAVLHSYLSGQALPVACIHSVLECLLICSQEELLRPSFASSLPLQVQEVNDRLVCSDVNSNTSLCRSLIAVARKVEAYRAHSLAILMNATLPVNENLEVVISAFQSGALDLSLETLGLRRADVDPDVAVRSAGLLGRLSMLKEVKTRLADSDMFRRLCICVAVNVDSSESSQSEMPEWLLEERSRLIRVMASLETISSVCKNIAIEEKLIHSLLAIFPSPREELGEVTATSVILMPKKPVSALLLGNTARCLMPYADDVAFAKLIYCEESVHGVEKLICALANCTDIRVRKNMAILIAKGCKIPEVKIKVEKLRGLEIIREIQDKI
eukprot:CAMPEP_0182420456 /NCGR_PEP_ID=MMETSP1167-20130531/5277_1 /TAXON_ID=2988 /ORGANISM="Mallomonas Sp, Strain CCMP3275" /LENGTH=975 /DNA_ID=CAMNT_0024596427 /DNA_START=14 /DNA_END=2941 /DNA_ORIENTATION=-